MGIPVDLGGDDLYVSNIFTGYSSPGKTGSSQSSNSGLLSLTPSYAGAGNLSSALSFSAPSPITPVTHTFGYGTTFTQIGQLELSTSGVANSNAFAITNTNPTGFAAITFRGKDFRAVDTTEVFEHGAIGWVPTGLSNVGFFVMEASSLTNVATFLPPPWLMLFQTGAVDPTGGVNVVCTTNGTTTLTAAANSTTNGMYIQGQDIPANTTIVSGGGTTTIVMSKAATGSHAGSTLNFGNLVILQRKVMDASPAGSVSFRDFSNGVILSIDRINRFIGIDITTPGHELDVNGSIRTNGTLFFSGDNGSITSSGGNPLALTAPNHIVQLNDNFAGQAMFKVANTNATTSQAGFSASTGTANSNVNLFIVDQTGVPVSLFTVGSAVTNTLWRAPQFFFQSTGGTTDFSIVPGTSIGSVSPFTTCINTAIPAGGTTGQGLKLSSTANFGIFFGSGAPSLSAAKGSLYIRSDGSTTNDRLYVNTNGTTTWTAVTTVA